MHDMLKASGFTDIKIDVKENAADIIKDWMPGSGAEKYVTSVYVTARKPVEGPAMRDDVKKGLEHLDASVCCMPAGAADAGCGPGDCGPGA